jgi:hypothetical protein
MVASIMSESGVAVGFAALSPTPCHGSMKPPRSPVPARASVTYARTSVGVVSGDTVPVNAS